MPLFKECQQLNLKPLECPSFLFVIMGAITITAIVATYLVAVQYAGPEVIIIASTAVTIISLVIGNLVVRSVYRIVQVHQMQSDFVSICSHQLRTPLAALKWSLEAFYKTNPSEKQITYLEIIQNSNQRMLKLVNDLLSVARIEQGKFDLIKENFDLGGLIRQIIKEFQLFARISNTEIIFNYKKTAIRADKTKMKMALENLIHNAIQYTKKRGRIEIKLKNNLITIKDNGFGIPKAQQKQIFTKFFRANNVLKHQTQGSGLGLYLAKKIIQAHQGRIWFKSKENKGTIFYIKLNIKI
ncbi:MAG: ATP-binding protein [bacterium]